MAFGSRFSMGRKQVEKSAYLPTQLFFIEKKAVLDVSYNSLWAALRIRGVTGKEGLSRGGREH